jgi:tRNA pseudouridine55 synthase
MKGILTVYKLPGETPLESLNRLRNSFSDLKKEKLSYAGRLDPLAQGVLIVLVGETNKERDKYLNLDKTYFFDVLFGVESDSFDPLGLIKKGRIPSENISNLIRSESSDWLGEREQFYPPFSSKTLNGKPLFQLTKEGKKVLLPSRKIFIYSLDLIQKVDVSIPFIVKEAKEKIKRVKGDFRQLESIQCWSKFEKSFSENKSLPLLRFKIRASSGTYVRSLAHQMGLKYNSSALAFHIVRVKVGNFDFKDTII